MIPVVNGRVYHFAVRGLYDGLFLMGDYESGSLWDHITGECVHGLSKGSKLETGPLLHTNVKQALAKYHDVHLAVSKQSLWQRLIGDVTDYKRRVLGGWLPPKFRKTMGKSDNRRPSMELGLGIWSETDNVHRYYPLQVIYEHQNALFDALAGRRILVYTDPISRIPTAVYTEASQFEWQGDKLKLSTGETVQENTLVDKDGESSIMERPMQMFTRWYGFAYTFPDCEVYQN